MADCSTKSVFLDSLERCSNSEHFVTDFYDRFTGMSPAIRLKYASIEAGAQGKRLFESLRTMASAVAGEPQGLRELSEHARSHGRYHLNITPDMYELWVEAILATASDHDPLWSSGIEHAWTHTLDVVVKFMINRY